MNPIAQIDVAIKKWGLLVSCILVGWVIVDLRAST